MTSLSRLIALGTPLGTPQSASHFSTAEQLPVFAELSQFYLASNGSDVYSSSLQLFDVDETIISTKSFNSPEGWRCHYGDIIPHEEIFFAHDVFGFPFSTDGYAVKAFDPESGSFETIASSLEEWASLILREPNSRTGFELAREWQKVNRPLNVGERLIPKMPFIIGGEFEIRNLYVSNTYDALVFRASLCKQIHDLPDGAEVTLKIIPPN